MNMRRLLTDDNLLNKQGPASGTRRPLFCNRFIREAKSETFNIGLPLILEFLLRTGASEHFLPSLSLLDFLLTDR
jgi:hypothetical protein